MIAAHHFPQPIKLVYRGQYEARCACGFVDARPTEQSAEECWGHHLDQVFAKRYAPPDPMSLPSPLDHAKRQTSRDAAKKRGTRATYSTNAGKLLRYFADCEDYGSTDPEALERFPELHDIHNAGSARNPLIKCEPPWIVDSGKRRGNHNGNPCIVWKLNPVMDVAYKEWKERADRSVREP